MIDLRGAKYIFAVRKTHTNSLDASVRMNASKQLYSASSNWAGRQTTLVESLHLYCSRRSTENCESHRNSEWCDINTLLLQLRRPKHFKQFNLVLWPELKLDIRNN